MSHESRTQSRGFTVDYYNKVSDGGQWLDSLDVKIQNWRHTISSFGGFDTAEFDLVDYPSETNDWIMNGLLRPIVARDETLSVMWEGFVNSITVTQGGLTVIYGPVLGIANRIFAVYSGVDTSVYPPVIGVRKRTPTQNHLESQRIWGIWPEVLSLAGVTDANSDQLVSMYMQEHCHPDVNTSFSFGGKDVTVSVQCLGWHHTLVYPYTDTTVSGTIPVSTRMKAIISAQINPGWLSTDYSRIQTNSTAIKAYEEDDRPAIEHLRGLTAMGDAALNRWMFGIYEGRQAVYEPISMAVNYKMDLREASQSIYDTSDAVVPAWKIRPGRWLFFQDFLPGLGTVGGDYHHDPRLLMIETVQFDIRVPTEVQFSGGIASKYETKSAQLGLRGTDV